MQECKATSIKFLISSVSCGRRNVSCSCKNAVALEVLLDEADVSVVQQAEEWSELALNFVTTARLSVHTILKLVFHDVECAPPTY